LLLLALVAPVWRRSLVDARRILSVILRSLIWLLCLRIGRVIAGVVGGGTLRIGVICRIANLQVVVNL
jgi:hypothetical protein